MNNKHQPQPPLNNPTMHLDSEPFSLIKDGHKTIEVRLNDAKRQAIEIGNIIKFINNKTKEYLEAKVIDLLKYPDFNSLLDSCDIASFGSNNKELFLQKLRGYYLEEAEKENGVVGIKIKVLES